MLVGFGCEGSRAGSVLQFDEMEEPVGTIEEQLTDKSRKCKPNDHLLNSIHNPLPTLPPNQIIILLTYILSLAIPLPFLTQSRSPSLPSFLTPINN